LVVRRAGTVRGVVENVLVAARGGIHGTTIHPDSSGCSVGGTASLGPRRSHKELLSRAEALERAELVARECLRARDEAMVAASLGGASVRTVAYLAKLSPTHAQRILAEEKAKAADLQAGGTVARLLATVHDTP
jgi:hypothetical protein